jgi:type III pantothenate kinase
MEILLLSHLLSQKALSDLISELNARGKFSILEIGRDILVPIKTLFTRIQSKLGVDRKIDAFGAVKSKKTPCLVFDFGTALTCDLIDEKGTFLGGLIIPGPATSLKSLLKNTAQLPKVFQIKPETGRSYGRNTQECIQHGVIQAYAAMTDGLIAKALQRV